MISPTQASRPVFAIVISEKGGAERREVFDRPEISVGRVQGNDLMLPKGNVSKRHARLIFRDGRFIVTDLNSTNGTYVNRRRISQATIVREGDRIYIGDFVLRIEVPEADSQSAQLADGSGSGPVPARESHVGGEGSVATQHPANREAEEPSGASYPQVPGPPRAPSDGLGAEARDSLSSDRSISSAADISVPDIDPRAMAQDAQTSSLRALAMLVEHALSALGPGQLDGDINEALRQSVDATLSQRVDAMRAGGELDGADPASLMQAARSELLELGPVGPMLIDAEVQSIGVARYDRIVAQRRDGSIVQAAPLSSPASAARILSRLCRAAGAPLGEQEYVVSRILRDGSRLSGIHSTATGPLFSIEKPLRSSSTLEDLVRRGTISRAMATLLTQAVAARVNLLVVGPRDSGTASVMSALLALAASHSPVVLADGLTDFDAAVPGAARLSLPSSEHLSAALTAVTRVPDARCAVELENPHVAVALLDAIGAGGDGVLAMTHTGQLSRALGRLTADMAALRTAGFTDAARQAVASSFDVVVEVARLRDGRHRVSRLAELSADSGSQLSLRDIFAFHVERTAAGGAVEGSFVPSGSMPRLAELLNARGYGLESSMFSRPPSR